MLFSKPSSFENFAKLAYAGTRISDPKRIDSFVFEELAPQLSALTECCSLAYSELKNSYGGSIHHLSVDEAIEQTINKLEGPEEHRKFLHLGKRANPNAWIGLWSLPFWIAKISKVRSNKYDRSEYPLSSIRPKYYKGFKAKALFDVEIAIANRTNNAHESDMAYAFIRAVASEMVTNIFLLRRVLPEHIKEETQHFYPMAQGFFHPWRKNAAPDYDFFNELKVKSFDELSSELDALGL